MTVSYTNFNTNGDFGDWISTSSNEWSFNSGSTGSSSTGPSSSFDGYYIYTEASGVYNTDHIIEYTSPEDEFITNIDFYYHMYGSSMGTLYLEYYDGSEWQELWSLSGDQGNSWENANIDVDIECTRIRFRGRTGSNFYSDMALDDITVTSKAIGIFINPDEPITETTTEDFNEGELVNVKSDNDSLVLSKEVVITEYDAVKSFEETSVNATGSYEIGFQFDVHEDINVVALQFGYIDTSLREINLWDVDTQELLVSVDASSEQREWGTPVDITPITLLSGKKYIISYTQINTTSVGAKMNSNTEFHNSISWVARAFNSNPGSYPGSLSATASVWGCVNFIIKSEEILDTYEFNGNRKINCFLENIDDNNLKISWNEDKPENTVIDIEYSFDDDIYTSISNGEEIDLSSTPDNVFIKQNLSTTAPSVTPQLLDITYELVDSVQPPYESTLIDNIDVNSNYIKHIKRENIENINSNSTFNKVIIKIFAKENINANDKYFKETLRQYINNITLNSTLVKNVTIIYNKIFVDNINVNDKVYKATKKYIIENIDVNDKIEKQISRIVNYNVTMNILIKKSVSKLVKINSPPFSVEEYKIITRTFADSSTINDNFTKSISKDFTDFIEINDNLIKHINRHCNEYININIDIIHHINSKLVQNITVDDNFYKTIYKLYNNENITLNNNLLAHIKKTFVNNINLSIAFKKERKFIENISVSDDLVKKILRQNNYKIDISDSYASNLHKHYTNNVNISSELNRWFVKTKQIVETTTNDFNSGTLNNVIGIDDSLQLSQYEIDVEIFNSKDLTSGAAITGGELGNFGYKFTVNTKTPINKLGIYRYYFSSEDTQHDFIIKLYGPNNNLLRSTHIIQHTDVRYENIYNSIEKIILYPNVEYKIVAIPQYYQGIFMFEETFVVNNNINIIHGIRNNKDNYNYLLCGVPVFTWEEPKYDLNGYRIKEYNLSDIQYYNNSQITWNSSILTNTNIIVEVSIDNGNSWHIINNGDSIPEIERYHSLNNLLIKTSLSTTDKNITPILHDLTLDIEYYDTSDIYNSNFVENIDTSININKNISTISYENININNKSIKEIKRTNIEKINISDNYQRNFNKSFTNNVSSNLSLNKKISTINKHNLYINDNYYKLISRDWLNSVNVNDKFTKSLINQLFNNNIDTNVKISKQKVFTQSNNIDINNIYIKEIDRLFVDNIILNTKYDKIVNTYGMQFIELEIEILLNKNELEILPNKNILSISTEIPTKMKIENNKNKMIVSNNKNKLIILGN